MDLECSWAGIGCGSSMVSRYSILLNVRFRGMYKVCIHLAWACVLNLRVAWELFSWVIVDTTDVMGKKFNERDVRVRSCWMTRSVSESNFSSVRYSYSPTRMLSVLGGVRYGFVCI